MGFLDKIGALWQQESQRCIHGWVQSHRHPAATVEPGAGMHYLQVRLAEMSLRFSRERFADRSPVIQSAIVWPVGGERITVAQTVDHTRFSPATSTSEAPEFAVYHVNDLALSGDLPLNSGDVEVNVALLAAPGSSLLDRATSFLNDIASLTLVPQLTVAAPVATKIAGGIDQLLGNEDVAGVLAFSTSVPADRARAGYYLLTDLPLQSSDDLTRFVVEDGSLLRWSDPDHAWQPAAGFSYLLVEFRVEGSKPTRWTELPEITDLSQAALERLAQASTDADVERAAPQMKLAAMKAFYSPDLAHVDRDPAAQAVVDQWNQQVVRLAQIQPIRLTEAEKDTAAAGAAPSVLDAAERVGKEMSDEVGTLRVGEVDVEARNVAGVVKGFVVSKQAHVVVEGRTRLVAEDISPTGTVVVFEVT